MKHDTLFQSSNRDISSVFGQHTEIYVSLSKNILPHALKARYFFEDHDSFEEKLTTGLYKSEEFNQIYWKEILFRSHISILSSLLRTCRLIDATATEYGTSNLPGWASCARALLENVGDSIDVLEYIPCTISENYHLINRCILGKMDRAICTAEELEEKLIEFMYARKPGRDEKGKIPATHIAKPTQYYIKTLEKYQIGDVSSLYKQLCELSHPAAASVQYMFSSNDEGKSFYINDQNDGVALKLILEEHSSSFDGLMMVTFNAILISFRLLDEFNLFPKIPPLRDVNFDNIPLWSKVKENLKLSHGKLQFRDH